MDYFSSWSETDYGLLELQGLFLLSLVIVTGLGYFIPYLIILVSN